MFMRRLLFLWLLPVALFAASGTAADSYFQQYVHYTIRVRLDTDEHMLRGTETILYRNNSPDTLRHFYLHLYPNAYKSKDSEFQRSYRRYYNVNLIDLPKAYRAYLDIDTMFIDGQSVVPHIDDTIARIDLPAPLLPGDSLRATLSFHEKIRKHIGRAGYRGKQYDFSQWYPKVVVYDENGWHADKFALGEFYGEFGTFDVFMEVPEDYVIAATGMVEDGDPGWNLTESGDEDNASPEEDADAASFKTVHFHADDVHDFAWCASPNFAVQDTLWNGVRILSFYKKGNSEWEDSTLVYGARTLEWLDEIVGPYPYPQLSIVHGLLSGGMEYPMLVMNGHAGMSIVLHEVGHNYFYGILANDEREEAWMDEGATTFQTGWYLREHYGPWGETDKWSLHQRITPQYTLEEQARRSLFRLERYGYGERVATRSEEFENSYYTMVYIKGALIFHALRYVVGPETFNEILKEYYNQWKFKHVNEERFRRVCEEVSGMDLALFFEQWLHTRKICDYKLEKVKSSRYENKEGYRIDVHIKRLGEIVMPLLLEVTMEDGSKETFLLDGRLRTIKESFDLPAKPTRYALNPLNEIMDINLSDNFQPRRRDLQFDWPRNYYYPENAYQIRYRPGFWYNDVDGFKAGLLLRGSYMGEMSRWRIGVYYGAKSDRVDFTVSLAKPTRVLGRNGSLSLSGYKMEGRTDITAKLFVRSRKTLVRPPSHDYTVGLNYHELTNRRFLVHPEFYETEPDLGPFLTYRVDPQFDILATRFSAALKMGREWWGGNFDYERLASTLTLRTRAEYIPLLNLRLRFFLGLIGGRMPQQQKFFIAGGGPLAQERRFFLRSPGAIWEELNYHEPGHGNLRGYLNGDFGVNRLLAMNFEMGIPHPFGILRKVTGPILGRIDVVGFADVGTIMDKQNPNAESARIQKLTDAGILDATLFDAGLSVRTTLRIPFYPLWFRLDLPFYVNHPEINGESDKFRNRYVFSLSGTF
jgi:hypothetical protein